MTKSDDRSNFDLKQCMEQDGGKCITYRDGKKYCESTVVYDKWRTHKGHNEQLLVIFHLENEDDFLVICKKGERHHENNTYHLENLPKTHEVNVFIVEYSDGVREIITQTSGDYIGPLKVLGSSKFTMTEGEFIEELDES